MARCRAPRERERWLSAVLIVAAIAAVSAAIVRWPLPPAPAVPQLATGPVPLVDVPVRTVPAPPRIDLSRPVVTPAAAPAVEDAAEPAGDPAVAASPDEPPLPVSEAAPGADAAATPPLLASGRLHVPADARPSGPVTTVEPAPAAPSLHPALVIMPVAVTRVVTVAGRGILIGLRATTAMLRAAF